LDNGHEHIGHCANAKKGNLRDCLVYWKFHRH
jgi:hypothetical protein